jgi:hypothetical protein
MKQSKEEAVKNGRKGGIKSGESRRAAAELRKKLAVALQNKYTNKDTGEQIEGTEAIILALMSKAMNKKDKDQLNAIKYIMTVLGADKSEAEEKKIDAEIELTKAKTKQLEEGKSVIEVENLATLADMLKIGKNDEENNAD